MWWVDGIIVNMYMCKNDGGKTTTKQAVHLSPGQIKCVGRVPFVMWAMSYFLSAERLEAILQEFIIYQTGWYPLWRGGRGWSLTPLGVACGQKGQSGCISFSRNFGTTRVFIKLHSQMVTMKTQEIWCCPHLQIQPFLQPFSFCLTHLNTCWTLTDFHTRSHSVQMWYFLYIHIKNYRLE